MLRLMCCHKICLNIVKGANVHMQRRWASQLNSVADCTANGVCKLVQSRR